MIRALVWSALFVLAITNSAAGQGCYGGGTGAYGYPTIRLQRNGTVIEIFESRPSPPRSAGYAYAGDDLVEPLPMPGVREYREPYAADDQYVRFRRPAAPRYYAAPSYYSPPARRPLFSARAELNLGGRRFCPQ